jgi:probable phosphoglycerate mutase
VSRLWLLRHGPTPWTEAKRIQGHSDIPLSEAGRATVAGWRLPPDLAALPLLCSPLARARQTAEALGRTPERVEPRLAERSWGDWEGERLADLRARYGAGMVELEARGLDMRPPGGETPRELQARLAPLLAELGAARRDVLAVTHRGVIRAVWAWAIGWDMTGEPPAKLRDGCAHGFDLAADGTPALVQLNRPLASDAG